MDFISYRQAFEQLIVKGVLDGRLGQIQRVSISPSRLCALAFGQKMGASVMSTHDLALDYYGLMKFSLGAQMIIQDCRERYRDKQIRLIELPVVYFASIKIDDVSYLAPELAGGFADFKREVLLARNFNGRKI